MEYSVASLGSGEFSFCSLVASTAYMFVAWHGGVTGELGYCAIILGQVHFLDFVGAGCREWAAACERLFITGH